MIHLHPPGSSGSVGQKVNLTPSWKFLFQEIRGGSEFFLLRCTKDPAVDSSIGFFDLDQHQNTSNRTECLNCQCFGRLVEYLQSRVFIWKPRYLFSTSAIKVLLFKKLCKASQSVPPDPIGTLPASFVDTRYSSALSDSDKSSSVEELRDLVEHVKSVISTL